MNLSIFQNLRKEDIEINPFPHVEIINALPSDLYEELKENYPTELIINSKDLLPNARYQISKKESLSHPELYPLWKDFISYHSSEEFFDEFLFYFGDILTELYPKFFNKSEGKIILTRNFNDEVTLDCLPGLNTPPKEMSSVRGPHLDNPTLLFDALLYFRDDNDTSKGADLLIQEQASNKLRFHGKAEVENRFTTTKKLICYKKNSLAFFINTSRSFHAVSPREVTESLRYLTAFTARLTEPLFVIQKPNKAIRLYDRFRKLF